MYLVQLLNLEATQSLSSFRKLCYHVCKPKNSKCSYLFTDNRNVEKRKLGETLQGVLVCGGRKKLVIDSWPAGTQSLLCWWNCLVVSCPPTPFPPFTPVPQSFPPFGREERGKAEKSHSVLLNIDSLPEKRKNWGKNSFHCLPNILACFSTQQSIHPLLARVAGWYPITCTEMFISLFKYVLSPCLQCYSDRKKIDRD